MGNTPSRGIKGNLLIVDDDPSLLKSLSRFLRSVGLDTETMLSHHLLIPPFVQIFITDY